MNTSDIALSNIPDALRLPLLQEFSAIVNNYMERRWSSSELSGGRFCEVVYTILDGHAKGTYPIKPNKPANFVDACKRLENNAGIPRSFQILIPRLLPALYEIRNNRNVGHVGGDVNPDFMDSSAVVSMASWILAEMIRVLHGVSTTAAQQIVDSLSERRIPLVWKSSDVRRVLNPDLSLSDQILLLIGSVNGKTKLDEVFGWTGHKNRGYFNRTMRQLHNKRFVELYEPAGNVELLPPGADYVSVLVNQNQATPNKPVRRIARKSGSR